MKNYACDWKHGPAPGLTYYSGTVEILASSEDDARERAKRVVAHRGCFDPRCVDVTTVRELGKPNTGDGINHVLRDRWMT